MVIRKTVTKYYARNMVTAHLLENFHYWTKFHLKNKGVNNNKYVRREYKKFPP